MEIRGRLRSVCRFFVSPRSFHAESGAATNPVVGLVLVVLFATSLAVGVWYVGELLAASTDATVAVDNPERPPDWVCDGPTSEQDSPLSDGCDEPATINREAGSLIREAVADYVPMAFVVGIAGWIVVGITLYVSARIAGGDGGFLPTLSVAAWGAVPELFRLLVGLVGLRYALGPVELTGSVESYPEQVLAAVAPLDPVLLVASLLVIAWQWFVLTPGIEMVHDLSRGGATAAVGIPLCVWAIVTVLS